MTLRLLCVAIRFEHDVVAARQRARLIAAGIGFESQDQARIATSVSEIARNAYRYAGGGEVEFVIEGATVPQVLVVTITDRGPGIPDLKRILSGRYQSPTGMGLGILGAHRLMDQCEVRARAGGGTEILLKKILPRDAQLLSADRVGKLMDELAAKAGAGPFDELQQQNRELIRSLDELRERQDELQQLNRELEDTNRGVVALYAELDERADHLRRADELKTRFLSNMSHEFRTPLNSIRALSQLLLERIDGPLEEEQVKQVTFIRKAAEDLGQLVDDLLDLAKIEAGKTEVHPAEFSVQTLFGALRGMLRPLLVSDRVALRFEESEDVPSLHTDEAKVSQILRNFISNALKFTERGEVRVSARLAQDRAFVVFEVADTGIGIPAEQHETIFQEFTQVPNSLQAKVKGTGLGLPLCRRLCALLGGSIELESEPGRGSTFRVTLPVHFAAAAHVDAIAPEKLEYDPSHLAVLVVEDRLDTQLFYEKILHGTAYQAIPARNLRQAREALARRMPAAIILDVMLRGNDTWRWLGELKNDVETRDVPVLVVTSVDDERKGYALRADVYLEKPVDRSTLLEHLNRLTQRRILLIDDDSAARYAIRRFVEQEPYHVLEAADARTGLRAANTVSPNLIVLDLQLPDMRGEDVLNQLKQGEHTSGIPVVVATSRALSATERDTLSRQAEDVIGKGELSRERLAAVLLRTRERAAAAQRHG